MTAIQVTSEINKLEKVLVHRPGDELLNLTPSTLEELLFDDIPDLAKAQAEHDEFAQILRDNGAEVVYLEDLMTETLDYNEGLRDKFLNQYLEEAGINNENLYKESEAFLKSIKDTKEFVEKTMAGITLKEIGGFKDINQIVSNQAYTAIYPMPNLYFTRDPFSSIANGVSINCMHTRTRRRETIYADYIFKYHKDFGGTKDFYGRKSGHSIEGGDILNINKNLVMVGISQRTELESIEKLANLSLIHI